MAIAAALLVLAVSDGGSTDLGTALEQSPRIRVLELGLCDVGRPPVLSAMGDDGSGVSCVMAPACRSWTKESQRKRVEAELCEEKAGETTAPPEWLTAVVEAARLSPDRTVTPFAGSTKETAPALRLTSPDALAVRHDGRWRVIKGLADSISIAGDATALAGEPAVLVIRKSTGGTQYMTGSTEALLLALRSPSVVLGTVTIGAWLGARSANGLNHDTLCEVALTAKVTGGRLRLVRGRVVQSKGQSCADELEVQKKAGDYCFTHGALEPCAP